MQTLIPGHVYCPVDHQKTLAGEARFSSNINQNFDIFIKLSAAKESVHFVNQPNRNYAYTPVQRHS